MSIRKNILSIILISIGILIPSFTKYEEYIHEYQEKINIKNFLRDKETPYLLILDIPKINLTKGIYNINDPNNNIDKNIKILNYSNLNNNTIFLASHSGTSNNTYFNDINNLDINDKIYIYYNKNKYTYLISKIYLIDKTGYLEKSTDIKDKLILITCSTSQTNKQLILEATLDNKSKDWYN